MNYDLLFSGSDSEKVEIAIIGVSGFNHSLFKYGMRSDKLSIRVLCGRNIQKCIDAYESNGVDKADIIHCKDREEGIAAYKDGKYLIFNDVSLAMQMPFHVVVEGTGHPEASAGYALAAIENGKHVIAVTKESDYGCRFTACQKSPGRRRYLLSGRWGSAGAAYRVDQLGQDRRVENRQCGEIQ